LRGETLNRVGLHAQLACIWEATAGKPGNVNRFCDFDNVSYLDFLVSAAAIAPILDSARERRVGQTVLAGVQASQQVVHTNTNLGILLLLAPLAAVPPQEDLATGVVRILDALDLEDSRAVFEAIRLASPGGLGHAPEQDVHDEPTLPLRQIMALAAGRDLIARQYAIGFLDVLEVGLPALQHGLVTTGTLEGGILHCHLSLMSENPDSLIARKRGPAEAEEAARKAMRVLEVGWPQDAAGWQAFKELDTWLRAEGHSRNPGTTADLVTACLFVALRCGILSLPLAIPWSWQPGNSGPVPSGLSGISLP
jgi:triphosphoribosyl-dephospho-CoA synthase